MTKQNRSIRVLRVEPTTSARLPRCQPARLEGWSYGALGLAAFFSVALLFSSIAHFVPNARHFFARLQTAPVHSSSPALAVSSSETNQANESLPKRAPAANARPVL